MYAVSRKNNKKDKKKNAGANADKKQYKPTQPNYSPAGLGSDTVSSLESESESVSSLESSSYDSPSSRAVMSPMKASSTS